MADGKGIVVIKKGTLKLECDRSELLEVCETHDGVVFNFKNGMQFVYQDQFMPQYTKEILRNTSNHYSNQKIIYDLDNEKQPTMIDAT